MSDAAGEQIPMADGTDQWLALKRHFEDATAIHRLPALLLRIYLTDDDNKLPMRYSAAMMFDGRPRRALRSIWITRPEGERRCFRPFVFGATLAACEKFEELADAAGRASLAVLASNGRPVPEVSPATFWAVQLENLHGQGTNAFHGRRRNGCAIDDAFQASARAIELILEGMPATHSPKPAEQEHPTKPMRTLDEVAPMVWKLLRDEPNLTIRELADRLGCSIGLISKTPAWKHTAAQRRQEKGPAKPKVVNLSDKTIQRAMNVKPDCGSCSPNSKVITNLPRFPRRKQKRGIGSLFKSFRWCS